MEESTIVFSFSQNRNPRESCLSSLKGQEFKENSIIMHRNSPLVVMIVDIELVRGATPRTANEVLLHILSIKKSLRSHEIYGIPENTHATEGDEEELFHTKIPSVFYSPQHFSLLVP